MLPDMKRNFSGSYASLMHSVWHIVATQGRIRLYSIRAAFGFGSMLAIWSCMAFHLAQPPFLAGSDMVGMLGMCGIAGALVASGLGKYVPRIGISRFSLTGAAIQLISWATAWIWSGSYIGLIVAVILVDIGLQCQQLSNQSGCIQAMPQAANRVNTIFMTTYFIGGSVGTFCAGIGWAHFGWAGVCITGIVFALISFIISLCERREEC